MLPFLRFQMGSQGENMSQKKQPAERRLNEASVLENTGKPLSHWYTMLDEWGTRQKSHKQIAHYLKQEHKLPPWWCQMVAVQYERDRGIREVNQKCDGEFSISKSITVDVSVAKVYSLWKDPRSRAAWLKPDTLEITTANENKNIRGKWDNGQSRVEIRFYPKGKTKTQAVIDHGKLNGSNDVAKFKKFWSEQVEKLKLQLEA
jgi:Domain of unknown function (DUF4287)